MGCKTLVITTVLVRTYRYVQYRVRLYSTSTYVRVLVHLTGIGTRVQVLHTVQVRYEYGTSTVLVQY